LEIACRLRPDQATLVPERREEVTTEGGLDVLAQRQAVATCIGRLKEAGIVVSLFLDADEAQIRAAADLEADAVELHTGQYALAKTPSARSHELQKLKIVGRLVRELGMVLHAGHGLTYRNVVPIARIDGMDELNIGHSIVSRAVMVGMEAAVREMKRLIS
jgi:pyridoxine 5-phosphate synthase